MRLGTRAPRPRKCCLAAGGDARVPAYARVPGSQLLGEGLLKAGELAAAELGHDAVERGAVTEAAYLFPKRRGRMQKRKLPTSSMRGRYMVLST